MATIKSYTDLEQSRKLAKILPLESADMCFNISQRSNMPPLMTPYSKFNKFFNMEKTPDFLIPCWSLAALFSVLPEKYTELIKEGGMYRIIIKDSYMTCLFSNPVDACVTMIICLHESNLL